MTLTHYTQVHIKQGSPGVQEDGVGGDQEESIVEDEEMIEDEMEENGNTEAVDSNQDDQFYVISTETS